ncbi:glycosyltransferase family 39 protein [Chloroflexus sp.]|uniref:glycosyltransferase family 39 protein n=1 Tax=Chloroflexus sp. TaxID=1904827 RepID=UPI002ACDE2F7|nr:glycosyltransferase family 39 protein [Chloroflexus sp.]
MARNELIQSSPTPLLVSVLDRVGWLLAIVAGLVLFAFLYRRGYDDPYITYRYALNLATGHGFVYNPGTVTLSTTAPLFGLILAPVALVGWPLPLAANLIGCLSHATGALALWRLGRLWRDELAGAAAALLYLLMPLPLTTLGSETLPAMALTLWAFLSAAQGRQWLTGALLGALVWLRPDGVLAGPLALLLLVIDHGNWRDWRRWPWVAALVWAAIVAAGLGLAWLVYGAPLPVTLYAKQQQALIPGFYDFVDRLQVTLNGYVRQPFYQIVFALAGIGLFATLHSPRWLILIGWAVLYGLAYTVLQVAGYFWYVAPLVIGLTPAFGVGVQVLVRLLQRIGGNWLSLAGAVLVLGGTVLWLSGSVYRIGQQIDQRLTVYRAAGEWLAANTAPAASVATLEIGIIGYYAQRPLIDFAGLLQPDIAAQLGSGGFPAAAQYAIDRYQPQYLVLQEQVLSLLAGRPDLVERCPVIAEIPDPRYAAPLTIHQCQW